VIEQTVSYALLKAMKSTRGAISPVLADLGVDLAIVDLPAADDPGLFDFLAELVRELEPLGRPLPAIASGQPESRQARTG
jgi:hypothetical protein